MSKMKSFVIPAMAAAVFAAAVPASASAMNRPSPAAAQHYAAQSFAAREASLERKIDRAVSQRRLDVRKGNAFKRDLMEIKRMERQFARGGLDRHERRQLEQRYERLEVRIDREIRADRRDDRRDGRPAYR